MVKHILHRLLYTLFLLPLIMLIQNNCAEKGTDFQDAPLRRSIEEINALINTRFENITCCDVPITSWSDGCSHIQYIHKNDSNDIICPLCKSVKLSAPCGLSCYLYCRDRTFFSCNFCQFVGKNRNVFVNHLKRNHLNEQQHNQIAQNNESPIGQLARLVVTKTQKKTLSEKTQDHTLYKCTLGYICNPYNQPITRDMPSENFW